MLSGSQAWDSSWAASSSGISCASARRPSSGRSSRTSPAGSRGIRARDGVQPGALGRDVQRAAERPPHPPALPVLVFHLRDREPGPLLGHAPPRNPGDRAADGRSRRPGPGPAPDGPHRPQPGGAPGEADGRGPGSTRSAPSCARRWRIRRLPDETRDSLRRIDGGAATPLRPPRDLSCHAAPGELRGRELAGAPGCAASFGFPARSSASPKTS